MSVDWQQRFGQVCDHVRETALLKSANDVLAWDEQTHLPAAAAEYRAEQMALLCRLVHTRRTNPQLGQWLDELAGSPLAADPHSDTGATIRQLRRQYQRDAKLPLPLVEELTRTAVHAQQVWVEARKTDNYAVFLPWLRKTFDLKREQAEALGYQEHLYDPLLDEFEPEARTVQVGHVLAALRDELVPLVEAVRESGRRPDGSILTRAFPIDRQERLGRRAAECFGFDFRRGRLDVTPHPFCTRLGPHDTRLTTRYHLRLFPSALCGIMHEAGHGLYEQGLPPEHFGLPLGEAVSTGIHESQSLLWEDIVGRSRAFWEYFYPLAQQEFPEALGDVALEDFYFALNEVRPSLIRVEADDTTYNLHILVRWELEQALLLGELTVEDLPAAWNERYRKYLGIQPPHDADGVLQDIHWSAGLVGYFATYALGHLYAAQFFAQARHALGDVDALLRRGDCRPLLDWLRTNIHAHGQRYTADELVRRVTGQPLSHRPLIQRLRAKLALLYGID